MNGGSASSTVFRFNVTSDSATRPARAARLIRGCSGASCRDRSHMYGSWPKQTWKQSVDSTSDSLQFQCHRHEKNAQNSRRTTFPGVVCTLFHSLSFSGGKITHQSSSLLIAFKSKLKRKIGLTIAGSAQLSSAQQRSRHKPLMQWTRSVRKG